MKWFNILMARLRALSQRENVLRDIDEELRSHVEIETEKISSEGCGQTRRELPPARVSAT